MRQRLSRGTPYILPMVDVENILASVTPRMVGHITALLGLTAEQWADLDDRVRARHIVDFQQTGLLAASLSATAKAHTDLEEAAHPITEKIEAETQADLLAERVAALTKRLEDLEAKRVPTPPRKARR